jgi:hypothetical protein
VTRLPRPREEDDAASHELSASSARLGAVLWPSFFAAGVATMVFFATVDPLELAAITTPQWEISREAGYTLGFFMFWACTAAASSFTALLLSLPARRGGGRP